MDKFKRYLGLIAAIAVFAFGFIPGDPDRGFPMASALTPLDSTLLTQLTRRQSEGMKFWRDATDYLNSCPPFQKSELGPKYDRASSCGGFNPWQQKLLRDREYELKAYEPNIHSLLDEYKDATNSERQLLREHRDDGQGVKFVRNPRNTELELQLGLAMAKYLDADRKWLAMAIYFIYALLIGLVVLMVRGRQTVGDVLCVPLHLFGVGAKAAKDLHDKV